MDLNIEHFLFGVNALTFVVIAGFASWIILNPNIKKGLFVNFGLMLLVIGRLIGMWHAWHALDPGIELDGVGVYHSSILSNIGLALIGLGIFIRLRLHKGLHRRVSDWIV